MECILHKLFFRVNEHKNYTRKYLNREKVWDAWVGGFRGNDDFELFKVFFSFQIQIYYRPCHYL